MNTIKFIKNWNNKLDCDYFTTIRLYTPEKWNYYSGKIREKFEVLLNGEKHCEAKLVNVWKKTVGDICFNGLNYTDAGLDEDEFYALMKKFYEKKKEWNKHFTICIILLFKRIE